MIPENAEEIDGEENILHTLTKYAGNRKFLNFMTGWLGERHVTMVENRKKNTDKIAIQSFAVPRARE